MKPFSRLFAFGFIMNLLTLMIFVSIATAQHIPPTRLARYQLSAYVSADSSRLRVNINKQPGGQLHIHLIDQKGTLLFDQTMAPMDTVRRYSLNLMELAVGNYTLKVSNGLEVIFRDFKIMPWKPRKMIRTITLL
ncbi:hypothetical protein M0L20_05400 [Spirosoma sp. RP8]|uniref:T9SS type A sorting domain-containing protein n=1 Tax=Spirosoma liriopis TaxID=2937440 RepID=A0ABT0HGK7_9BACT|nr:hypothetical protein [Spirosoma liriopis]MCK8491279.1 hypothetical protein [Spirosoma liriopis]